MLIAMISSPLLRIASLDSRGVLGRQDVSSRLIMWLGSKLTATPSSLAERIPLQEFVLRFPMVMELATTYVFEAAHRIVGHPGKCAWLHGHTYQLEVTVSSATLNPLGMVMDFDDLRDVVRKAILDLWDHATLLAVNDPLGAAISAVQREAPDRVVLFPGPPTAEVLTREAWERLERQLPTGITLERVAIRETPACGSALSRHAT
ncbi:MAG TPA: 6-pyruvoyl tetrahydropterin synthase family protein [Candidatus Acidoferrales bacterium]|nr:6-pyruvoyl tetrahydropterin synthase family protein [Candidatus Acidoferrales bacterium]